MQIELPKQLHQTSTAYDHNNINEQINALVASRSSMASVSSSWKTLHMHCMDAWWLHYLHPVLHAAVQLEGAHCIKNVLGYHAVGCEGDHTLRVNV